MKITIKDMALCGKTEIPPGEYYVNLNTETSQILLQRGGHEIKLPATRRRKDAKNKVMRVNFVSGGGTLWSLVVSAPHEGEFIATLEYKQAVKK